MKRHCKLGKDRKRKPEVFSNVMEADVLSVTQKQTRSYTLVMDTGAEQPSPSEEDPAMEICQDHSGAGKNTENYTVIEFVLFIFCITI